MSGITRQKALTCSICFLKDHSVKRRRLRDMNRLTCEIWREALTAPCQASGTGFLSICMESLMHGGMPFSCSRPLIGSTCALQHFRPQLAWKAWKYHDRRCQAMSEIAMTSPWSFSHTRQYRMLSPGNANPLDLGSTLCCVLLMELFYYYLMRL